jgi:Chaperone of endosialidase/Collagen triple helix repeat (20 copies)
MADTPFTYNTIGVSGYSGFSGNSTSGYSGFTGASGYSGFSGISGWSGISGFTGWSGFSGTSGWSGFSGISGYSGFSGISGYSGFSGFSGAFAGSTGTANYVAKFTGTNSIGTGLIYDTGSTAIGIGTTAPASITTLPNLGYGAAVVNRLGIVDNWGGQSTSVTSAMIAYDGTTPYELDFLSKNIGGTATLLRGRVLSADKFYLDISGNGYLANNLTAVGNNNSFGPYNNSNGVLNVNTGNKSVPAIVISNFTGVTATSAIYMEWDNSGIIDWYAGMNNGSSTFQISRALSSPDFSIDSSGRVGIGTGSPSHKLDVFQGSNTYTAYFSSGGSTGSNYGTYTQAGTNSSDWNSLYYNASNSFLMGIRGDGNVGIGTTSPNQLLTVDGGSSTGGDLIRLNSSNSNGTSIAFNNTSTNGRLYRIGSNFSTGTGEFAIYDSTASTTRVTISSAGNVGIGTTVPYSSLHVRKGSGVAAGDLAQYGTIGSFESTDTNNTVTFVGGGYTNQNSMALNLYAAGNDIGYNLGWRIGTYADSSGAGGSRSLRIYQVSTSGTYSNQVTTEVMRINPSGNVGIGTATPPRKLSINSGSNSIAGIISLSGSGNAIEYNDFSGTHYNWIAAAQYNINNAFEITPSTATGGTTYSTPVATFLQSGNVGIGTTSPSYLLDVNGSARIVTSLGVGTAPSGTTGEIRATGNITAYYSDDRLKTKLGKIENALDKICSLEGFYYEANETAQALGYKPVKEVGVSAQAIQKVLPEIVAPAPISDEYLTIRYERLAPLIIEAIKELRKEIKALK